MIYRVRLIAAIIFWVSLFRESRLVNMFSFKRSIKCVSKKRTWFSIVGFPFGLRGGGGSTIVL